MEKRIHTKKNGDLFIKVHKEHNMGFYLLNGKKRYSGFVENLSSEPFMVNTPTCKKPPKGLEKWIIDRMVALKKRCDRTTGLKEKL